ncbi:MAG: tripartite tricarboxylate transporter TctB family protein [Desulfobacterales bacterium]|nr:tripartite tricarboxylate transporter TctB family protein [Desulfobacterales bacterium]
MTRWPKGAEARDAISAIVFLVISIVGFVAALDFPKRAANWPLWMWGLLGVFSLGLLAGSLRPRPVGKTEKKDPATFRRSFVNVALIAAFAVSVPILGFFTATGIYIIVHMTYLGVRPFSLVLAVTAGGLLFLYFFFGFVLGVPVPHGLLY